jgi:alpha-tubulin suppressor-like RCC1 family protein
MSSQVSLNSTGSQLVSNDTNTSNYILNTSNFLQQNINTKQSIITGGASSIITNDLTTGMVLVSDGSGKVSTHETITSDKLTFLDGVTSSIQTQINSKEPSFTVLGLSKGGIGTTSISANTILGATTANTVSTISLGTGLSITGSTLNASSIALFSLANNYIDLNMTNTYTNIIKESFDTAIVKYNNNYNITNNSNFLIKNILNFNNNYILQQSDYIDTVNYNNIVKVVCSDRHTVFLENTGRVLANGVNSTSQGITGTRTINTTTIYVSEYVLGTSGSGQMTGIVNIVCSSIHTVFLENTGKVLACGYNNVGGTGITGTRATNSSTIYIPEYVLAPGGSNQMTGIVNIACASYHTVFIENTLKIIACGYNISTGTNGQGLTGTRSTNGTVYIPEYVLAPGGSNQMTGIVNMVCAEQHTVYLENTGRVLACGNNNNNNANGFGITGTRVTNGTVYVPEYVLGIGGTGTQMTGIVKIVCGSYHTVYLENTGKVLACGLNAVPSGITGTRTTQGIEYVAKYVLGTGGVGTQITGIVNIICSLSHTVYLENTGKVLACGYNNNNNAGSGITGTRTTNTIEYVAQYVLGIGGLNTQMTGIVNITCPDRHTIFLENTGKVLSCGQNSSTGITGTLTATGVVYVPQYVLGTLGLGTQMTGIVNMVCSINHTVFLENTGRALACGANNAGFGITGTRTTAGVVYVSQYVIYTQSMFKNYLNIDTTYYNSILKIACSQYNTVFLENTGKVLACGFNSSSGNGITATSSTSGTVYVTQYVLGTSGVSMQMTGIINIVCSDSHTVYLENTGRVLACGLNNANSGGNGITGTLTTNSGIVYIPQYVLGTSGSGQMTGIVNIVCSGYNTVYLDNTGKVFACGFNNANYYGYGITGTLTTNSGIVYVPQYVLGTSGSGQMTGIVNIVCSNAHTVYLENTGKVLACGYIVNGYGITGTTTVLGTVYVPQYVLGTSGSGQMTGIVNIVCSNAHTLFIENTGKVLACGNNNYVGITGTLATSGIVYVPQYVLRTDTNTQMTGIVSIVCSDYHTVFLENTGKVLACGFNNYNIIRGITGTLTTNSGIVYVPQYVLGISGSGQMTGIVSIVCSEYHTVFLENTGKVLACGINNYNVGITGTLTTNIEVYVPQYVLGTNGTGTQMTGIVNIVCSQYHTLFIENTGKTLACGYNTNGNGITGTSSTFGIVYVPQYVIYTQNLFKNYIKNAINGNNCIFAITDTNNVIANYDNTYGKLGSIYPGYNYNNFVTNYTGSGNLSGVTKIACGLYHTVFLLNTNTAYSCGFNIYGQLGTNNTTVYTIPTAITNGTFITNIACGLYHTILLSGTTAKSCGLNNYGQLGLNDNNNRLIISDITTLANVSDIDCGEYFTVLKVENTVYSTGLNDKGQLGVGDITNKIVPIQVVAINNAGGTITNVNLIKCTKNNIIFLMNNNTIAVCGNNINNIYNSNVAYYTFPSLIKSISEIKTNISTIYTNIYTDEIYIKTS